MDIEVKIFYVHNGPDYYKWVEDMDAIRNFIYDIGIDNHIKTEFRRTDRERGLQEYVVSYYVNTEEDAKG